MPNRRQRPQLTITLDPLLLTKLETGILEMSRSIGREISTSEAVNNILADYFGIPRSELIKFRQRRIGTKIAVRRIPPLISAYLDEYENADEKKRRLLLKDPDKGDIIKAFYSGKEL